MSAYALDVGTLVEMPDEDGVCAVDFDGEETFDVDVAQPWFDHMVSGLKTVEGRLNKGKFAGLKAGQVLSINNVLPPA